MKCPKCGADIPEGNLYCGMCGTEIKFVPEFEPEIENRIDESLSHVADDLAETREISSIRDVDDIRIASNKRKRDGQKHLDDDRLGETKDIRDFTNRFKDTQRFTEVLVSKKMLPIYAVVLALIAVIIVSSLFIYRRNQNSNRQIANAITLHDQGNLEKAIKVLEKANKEDPSNSEITFRLSDYLIENGEYEEAVTALEYITDHQDQFDESVVEMAYEGVVAVYEHDGEYQQIYDYLLGCPVDNVRSKYRKYLPADPIIVPDSGDYDQKIAINITTNTNGKVYYTVNGVDPTEASIEYNGEILLEDDGTYEIKACLYNEYGIRTETVSKTYNVLIAAPSAPQVIEPSGDYNQNTKIVCLPQEGCSVFYTTDGTDPDETSKQYISPISMPIGSSVFKFIQYNDKNIPSEITTREYHLVYSRLVSTEQAVNMLVATLVRLDILLDNQGKVRGEDGYNQYIYQDIIEIEGSGEYYMIKEQHVTYDGNVKPTGLLYAVNTNDGTVNRLGYDSSGKYILITISNR